MTPATAPTTATARQTPNRPASEDPGGPRSEALRTLLDDLLAERFGARPAAARRNHGDAVTADREAPR